MIRQTGKRSIVLIYTWPEKKVGDLSFQSNVNADYNKKIIKGINELKNTDVSISGEEGHVSQYGEGEKDKVELSDGIVQIRTSIEQDNAVKAKLNTIQSSNADYNACSNNCSTFVQDGLKAIFPSFDASQVVVPESYIRVIYKTARVVAPNNLFNAALQQKGAFNAKGPAHVVAKPYLEYYKKD